MTSVGEVLVLVEGYDDRAFWSGYLQSVRGCTASINISSDRLKALPPRARDLLKQSKGTYTYLNAAGDRVLRVVPYQEQQLGEAPLWALFDESITGRFTRPETPLRGIIVCRDDDGTVGDLPRHRRGDLVQRLGQLNEEDRGGATGIELRDQTLVIPVTWRCEDADDPVLPAKQTLERVVCAALHHVHPNRAKSAREWLASRPDPSEPAADHKASAGALWAGWHARDGWAYFFEGLWHDPAVREALTGRLPILTDPELAALIG